MTIVGLSVAMIGISEKVPRRVGSQLKETNDYVRDEGPRRTPDSSIDDI